MVTALNLYDRAWSPDDGLDQIRRADIVYVGGGNTLRMMKLWRRRGIDQALIEAAAKGTVMAGVSAGAICWASRGVSDSRAYSSTSGEWSFIGVRGLGLIDIVLSPHHDPDGPRATELADQVARTKLAGLGLPDCTALQVIGDEWRILSCRDGAAAQRIATDGEAKVVTASESFENLESLVA